jgi:LPXTG-motif cell wall-anchored protein
MTQDCHGKVLASVGAIEREGLGGPVFAVNGKAGTPFSPAALWAGPLTVSASPAVAFTIACVRDYVVFGHRRRHLLRKYIIGFVAGALLGLAFSAPAAATASEPITFNFTDKCDYVEIVVINNSASAVEYTLATTIIPDAFGELDFTLPAGGTKTHQWTLLPGHGIRATSPALAAPIHFAWVSPCGHPLVPPNFTPDCQGNVLAIAGWTSDRQSDLAVFAVNGKRRTPFSRWAKHTEIIAGLKVGDEISFLIPALSDPNEWVTWHVWTYAISSGCAYVPPATLTATCAGINVKMVNTDLAGKLTITRNDDPRLNTSYQVAQGESLDVDLPMVSGIAVAYWWRPGLPAGEPPLSGLLEYAKPQACDAPPSNGGGGGQLPTTGTQSWILLAGGGLLLLVGGALFLLGRRRSRIPVA